MFIFSISCLLISRVDIISILRNSKHLLVHSQFLPLKTISLYYLLSAGWPLFFHPTGTPALISLTNAYRTCHWDKTGVRRGTWAEADSFPLSLTGYQLYFWRICANVLDFSVYWTQRLWKISLTKTQTERIQCLFSCPMLQSVFCTKHEGETWRNICGLVRV